MGVLLFLEHISKPEISLDVLKSAAGDLTAIVRCRCDTGTPLNTFSLLNDTDIIAAETTDRLQAIFNVSIQLNRDMGWVRCNASNHGNWMLSNAKSLSVGTYDVFAQGLLRPASLKAQVSV